MIDFLRRNRKILFLFIIWFFVGKLSTPLFFVIGGASLLLLWRKQMYFEILLGFFFILILSDHLGRGTDFAKVFKNAYIVILALIAILDRKRVSTNVPLIFYFIPFIIVAVISLAFSPSIFVGAQKTLSYALLIFAIPPFYITSVSNHGPIVVKDIIYLGIALILMGYVLNFLYPGLAFSHYGRFRSIFGNPNGLGIFAALMFAFTIVCREYFKALFTKIDMRWIVITLLVSLVLCGSRTAVLASGLLWIMTRFYRFSPFAGFLLFLILGFGAELITQNIVQIVTALGLEGFFRIETLDDGSGRYVAWNFAWENIQQNFWLGRGFAFDEWLMTKNADMLSELGHQGGVHNTYLIIWLNTGLIGLVLFMRVLFLLFIKASKNVYIAFPVLWMVMFTIFLEPWLAASLNPFTIIFLLTLTTMVDPLMQKYLKGTYSSFQIPDEKEVLA